MEMPGLSSELDGQWKTVGLEYHSITNEVKNKTSKISFVVHSTLHRLFLCAWFLLRNFNWTPWNRIVIAWSWICIGIIVT